MNDDEVALIWDENAADWTSGVRAGLDVYRDAYNNPAFLRFLGSVEGLVAALGARVFGIDVWIGFAPRAHSERVARL